MIANTPTDDTAPNHHFLLATKKDSEQTEDSLFCRDKKTYETNFEVIFCFTGSGFWFPPFPSSLLL